MMSEKKEKPVAAFFSIVFALVLLIGSAGWLLSNVDEAWGWIFDREDPVPTETAIPDDGVDAVLYAECQEQLKDALEGLGPILTDADKLAHAEYLDEAQMVYVRMRDLTYRGRALFDELKAEIEANTDRDQEYRDEWQIRAQAFRVDLYASIETYRDLGVGDQYIRIHSELFVAYSWLDRYSDQINNFFTSQKIETISDQGLNRAEGHLDTVRDLLNR